MLSSLFQIFIGFSGLMGLLLRFIGPLTVAPTISLVGLSLYEASSDFAGKFFRGLLGKISNSMTV